MHQQGLVRAMLLRLIRTNRSSKVLCHGLDLILKFVVTLAFKSESRSAYDVVRTEGNAC